MERCIDDIYTVNIRCASEMRPLYTTDQWRKRGYQDTKPESCGGGNCVRVHACEQKEKRREGKTIANNYGFGT